MPGQSKHGIECSEFELLLSEALDRKPGGARMEQFEGHRRTCPVCGPLFADAETGQKWLHSLEEVAPPVHLVHNILAATSGIESGRLHRIAAEADRTPFSERLREA